MVLVRYEYLVNYTSNLYNFGISLKRSYLSFRCCKEIEKIRIFYMIFYSQKLRDPRKYCFYHPGRIGVVLFQHNDLKIFISYFINLVTD